MKKRIFPILLVMALLIAALSVTAMAATEVAPNEVSDYAKNTMSPLFADGPDYVDTWCPACNANARFYETTAIMSNNYALTNDASHWYISKSLTHGGGYKAPAGKKLCIYLNGCDLTSTGVLFETYGTLNVIGNGTETVSGSNYGASYKAIGATFDIMGGTVNLYGGNYTKNNTNAGPVVGVRNAAATVNIYNGTTVTGGVNSGGNGGNIGLFYTGSALNVYGGTVTGGQAANGGNIGVSATGCTVNISGGTVSGGVATSQGGNIYASASATVNLNGGTVSAGEAPKGGNIFSTASTVNIGGATVTEGKATTGNGGNIYAEGGTLKITSGAVSDGSAGNWGGNIYSDSYTDLTITGGELTGGNAKYGGSIGMEHSYLTFQGGSVSGGTASIDGGNIYLSVNAAKLGSVTINNSDGGTAPSVSNGTASGVGGNIYMNITSGKTYSISDLSVSAGTAPNGGSLYVKGAGTLNMTDVSITGGTAASMGGNAYVSGIKLTLTDCDVSGGSITGEGNYKWGGNFYLEGANGQMTVAGTTEITGGSAPFGGSICVYDSATLKIESGRVTGGTAVNYGGNIYIAKGTLNQTGGTVKNGTSGTECGGNLYVPAGMSATISNATYEGGSAPRYGGSIYSAGTLTVTDTDVSGGKSTGNPGIGGNIAVMGGTATVTGGSVTGGEAKSGGNLYVYKTATSATFSGVTIENGTAGTGGNAYTNGNTTFTSCVFKAPENAEGTGTQIYNDATVTLNGSALENGTVYADGSVIANNATVNAVHIRQGTMTLDGNATVGSLNLSNYNDIKASLSVRETYSGSTTVTGLAVAPTGAVYGTKLDALYTSTGDFSGKVILNWLDGKPWAFHDNGGLVVGNARTVKKVDDTNVITWHKDNAAAVAAYGDADMMYPGNHELPLAGGNYVVNVSGWNMNVTGTGNVTFYDSANSDFKTYGTVTVNGPTVNNTFATVGPDGNTYYMVKDGNSYSFHRLAVKVNGVSIRPSVAGIYYTSVWQCDDLLKNYVKNFGVAVSLKDQPDEGFIRDEDTLYTEFDKYDFVSGKTMTSVIISGILMTDKDNQTRAAKPIFATAYIVLDDGVNTYTVVDGDAHNYSLKQVMEIIDSNEKVYLSNKTAVDNFYTAWESVMNVWGLTNITGTPAEDETLNVLMIGNSFSYYYVQELYDMLAADGIDANIYNLYKSGCTMEEHYNWWNSNHNGYQFFWKTSEDGYNLVKGDATMAEALLAENWDVISIQESLFKNIQSEDSAALLAQNRTYRDTLIPMLKKAFPNAEIYWHQQWSPEVGFDKGTWGGIADAAAQAAYVEKEEAAALAICEAYGIKRINTGEAWAIARANENLVSRLPYGGLCARIGEASYGDQTENCGDGYHDGDIGGGQFLNACVWYEVLTGKDCRGKTFTLKTYNNNSQSAAYAPYYELDATLVGLLQDAAHEAVANLDN